LDIDLASSAMNRRIAIALLFVATLGCGDDDGAPPGGDGWRCGEARCEIGVEACVVRTFAPATCEPRVGEGLDDIAKCRAHVDAYCDGRGERCDEGAPDGGTPEGGYVVLCL
jgi:hypothetical protein